jgi:hypothetical protein
VADAAADVEGSEAVGSIVADGPDAAEAGTRVGAVPQPATRRSAATSASGRRDRREITGRIVARGSPPTSRPKEPGRTGRRNVRFLIDCRVGAEPTGD